MAKWIIMCRVTLDGVPTDRWEIVSECMSHGEVTKEFRHYKALYGAERVRMFVDYFQLKAGDI